jgi:predicted GNAT family acetyltransferase
MRRLVLVLVLGLVAALLAAGCSRPQTKLQELPTGPLTKDEYVHAFDVSAAGLAPKYGVGKALAPDAPAKDQDAHVVALQRLLRAWAARLEGLQPPAAAARAQARYVAGVRSFATDLDQARAALARDDTKGAAALLSSGRIVSPTTRAHLAVARRAFHRLGYNLQDLDSAPVKTP